jgi:hypothetical protein
MVYALNAAGISKFAWNCPYALPWDPADYVVSAANAPVSLVIIDPDDPVILSEIHVGYGAGPGSPSGSLQIADGVLGVVWGPFAMEANYANIVFNPPRQSSGKNVSITITLGAGGSGLVGSIWANAYKIG